LAMTDLKKNEIIGYRTLSEEEIEVINEIKRAGTAIKELVDSVNELDGCDKRWAAIARTDLQKGFMSLVRSIAKPTNF